MVAGDDEPVLSIVCCFLLLVCISVFCGFDSMCVCLYVSYVVDVR